MKIPGAVFPFGAAILGSRSKSSIDTTNLPEELRGLLNEQKKINEEQQLVTLLSNVMKSKHDSAMTILNNMK